MENATPCTFTPFVKSVYAKMAGSGAPAYDDLPEREQSVWRLLAHAMMKIEQGTGSRPVSAVGIGS